MIADQGKAALSSEDDAGVDDVIASLSDLARPPEEDEDEDEHPRWIEIEFPREVDMLHRVASLSIPIKQILTWMASYAEDERLLAIRDDFYDEDDDDGFMMSDQYQDYDREELARLRFDRRNKKAKREYARNNFPASESIIIDPLSSEERWGVHVSEGLGLEAEQEVLGCKSADLDRKWDEYVETAGDRTTSPNWIEVARSELKLEGCKLDLEFSTLMARMDDLERSISHN